MKLSLQRELSSSACTYGKLSCDGKWLCDTLEDVVREIAGVPVAEWKIPKETAIPSGHYIITLALSPHFVRSLPCINAVAGFTMVWIHPGNSARDTAGCVLVGKSRGTLQIGSQEVPAVLDSRAAFEPLFDLIQKAILSGEEVSLDILNPVLP